MSLTPSVDSHPVGERRRLRSGALAMAVLMLVTACATGAPPGGRLAANRHHPPKPLESPDAWALEAETDDEDPGEGEVVFARLPTDFAPVQVGDAEFTDAVVALALHMPMRVATSRPPLTVGRRLALASEPLNDEAWRSDLARSYRGFCERRGTPGDCLTLFEDGPRLQDDDKRSIALALAVGPALEGVDAEVRAMLDPTALLTTVSISIAGYMALLLAPEPVSKGVALAFTALLWGYLGWEFFDLLRAYARLHEDAPRASTFAELREISERFGRVIGPNSLRILVMVGTAAIGETAALAARATKLPGFGQASRTVEASTRVRLLDAATGAERIIVSGPEGTIRVVLPRHVVAMAARSGSGGRIAMSGGKLLPNGHVAFKSFRAFKRLMGNTGTGKQWHHIVEQHRANLRRFGAEALHNTENVVLIEQKVHERISAFYSSIQKFSEGMTVRKWLSTQSYEAQRAFGLQVLRDNGVIP